MGQVYIAINLTPFKERIRNRNENVILDSGQGVGTSANIQNIH